MYLPLINTLPLSTARKPLLLNLPKQGSELHGFLSFTQLVLSYAGLGDAFCTKHTLVPLCVTFSGPSHSAESLTSEFLAV